MKLSEKLGSIIECSSIREKAPKTAGNSLHEPEISNGLRSTVQLDPKWQHSQPVPAKSFETKRGKEEIF